MTAFSASLVKGIQELNLVMFSTDCVVVVKVGNSDDHCPLSPSNAGVKPTGFAVKPNISETYEANESCVRYEAK
ncbi:hypothetical protein TYRP_004436 [Tyrophagus putrescentiae]|nr:hypothetical protein TYRP_004436 [Tyrophagus putrescentiae]